MIELICQFANYTDEFVWWLRYAYVSPCVSAAFIDRKWIVESLHVCVKILVNRVCVCIYALYLLAERVRAQTRLRVLTLDRASVRGIGHT